MIFFMNNKREKYKDKENSLLNYKNKFKDRVLKRQKKLNKK